MSCFHAKIINASAGRLPVFQSGGLGSIPCGVRDFNLYPGSGYVFFACVLSYVDLGGGPNFLLTTCSGRSALVILFSVLVYSLATL